MLAIGLEHKYCYEQNHKGYDKLMVSSFYIYQSLALPALCMCTDYGTELRAQPHR